MKLRYDADYRCRSCGIFPLKEQQNIHESIDCPKCHRISEFVRGVVWRIPDGEFRKKHKSQKDLVNEEDNKCLEK